MTSYRAGGGVPRLNGDDRRANHKAATAGLPVIHNLHVQATGLPMKSARWRDLRFSKDIDNTLPNDGTRRSVMSDRTAMAWATAQFAHADLNDQRLSKDS
jgi:hypothetical protein